MNVTIVRLSPPRSGFTLLEVMLAMLLVSFVLIALMTAIDTQFRVVESTRSHVEEAQLARILLHRIADDLRSLVPQAPSDTATSGTTSSSSESPSDLQSEESQTTETTEESTESTTSAPKPGLSGGSDWIQFDICRLPRPDQWERLLLASEAGMAAGQLLGLRTVAYYLASDEQIVEDNTGLGGQSSGGLVRQETAWGTSSDVSALGLTTDSQTAEPLAPEVTELGFRYSDGTEWQDSWDSSESGQLPVAVEITLAIRPPGATSQASSELDILDEEDSSLVYRLVVALPAVQASSSTDSSGMEEMGQETETPEEDRE